MQQIPPSPEVMKKVFESMNKFQPYIKALEFLSAELDRLHTTIRVFAECRESRYEHDNRLKEVSEKFHKILDEYYMSAMER